MSGNITPSSSKRLDLQGIRGLAILSVLGFHFYPSYFPNGYLGVDQFFVLSGFLMCMLLTKTENMPVLSAFIHFYSRRFKRILPLYLLFILLTLVALYTIFPDSSLVQNQSSATKALIFVSNRPHTGEEDYFEKLLIAIDLFTHTWSLSVEIQFYFIVPHIFIIGNKLNGPLKYGYYSILGLISFIFYSLLPPEVSFNSLFARVWQFLIGMIIYLKSLPPENSNDISYKLLNSVENGDLENDPLANDLSDYEEEEIDIVTEGSPSKPSTYLGPFSKYCFLIPMGFVVTYPIEMFPFLTRPVFTFFTGFLMLVSIDDEFLSNKVLTYIGDISYSLYLVHWPIYAFATITFEKNSIVLAGALLFSFILAVIIYETYEKYHPRFLISIFIHFYRWYLKLSNSSCALLIISLFIINVILINKDAVQDMNLMKQLSSINSTSFERLDGVYPNMTFDDATRLNRLWNKYDIEMMVEPGCVHRTPNHNRWCDYEVNGDEFKIAIFGNSYTVNHQKMLIQECKYRSYNITVDSERETSTTSTVPTTTQQETTNPIPMSSTTTIERLRAKASGPLPKPDGQRRSVPSTTMTPTTTTDNTLVTTEDTQTQTSTDNDNTEEIEMVPLRTQANKKLTAVKNWKNRIRTNIRNKASRSAPNTKRRRNDPIRTPDRRTRTFEVTTVEEDGMEVLRIEKTASRTPTPPLAIIGLATILMLITSAAADVCDSTYPITHDETTCNERGICRVEKIENIFFTPQTKTVCLQLTSTNNVIFKLKLTVDHNVRKCQKGPVTFTKNVSVHADSSKRCHGMGECVDRKCLDVGPNSKLEEFSEGNKYPGHTYCSSSCGGLWCKCLLPTEGCLFYRTYAVPTTDENFQIYSCEAWSNAIKFVATTTLDNEVTDRIFLVHEGEEKTIHVNDQEIDIKVKLLEINEETGLSILEIHPWHLPDPWTLWSTLTKGVIPITLAILGMLLSSFLIYLCCIPACMSFLSRRRRFRR
uniref:Acyl_transf_3 domain-containing protein n=1 Tax=Caenorhabditis tropicalis TaxID=1561998 RepID=A0A1I7TX92_9PELO